MELRWLPDVETWDFSWIHSEYRWIHSMYIPWLYSIHTFGTVGKHWLCFYTGIFHMEITVFSFGCLLSHVCIPYLCIDTT